MKLLKNIVLLYAVVWSLPVSANHSAGGYFEYTCLGNNDYRVDFYFLRDCSGNEPPNAVYFKVDNSCSQVDCMVNQYLAPLFNVENIDYGCGNECAGNPSPNEDPSLQLCKYSAIINLSYPCNDWTISVSISARNTVAYAEQILGGANGANYYTYCKINNTNDLCGSSVQFSGMPFAMGCTSQNGRSKYQVNSPSGMILEYSFVAPQSGECYDHADMQFTGGASVVRPHPSTTNFLLFPNGEFQFTPSLVGDSYFAVLVKMFNASNQYLGETVIDGMILVSNDCNKGHSIDFSDWFFDDDNILYVNGTGHEICGELHLTPNDNSEEVLDGVYVTGLPSYMSYTVEYNVDGTANVIVCGTFPDEISCQDVDISVTVNALTDNASCMSIATGASWQGHYHIVKQKSLYCTENLYFTNRNEVSGSFMPLIARAQERIWVGDNMPLPYNPTTMGAEGEVVVHDGTVLTAGIEIILPACDVGTSCVTLEGEVTLSIDPFVCSTDCPNEPLDIAVDEIFDCGHEQLSANVGGSAPFTFVWQIDGQVISTTDSYLFIHDIVSAQDGGQIPYTVTVYDAIGGEGTFSGQVLGTKRLYEPIVDNTIFFDYPEEVPYEDGNYYAANLGVGQIYNDQTGQWTEYLPFFIYDGVNPDGPWYGATHMRLAIWDRWGLQLVHFYERDLEGGTDWSFNQGEIYWNGHWWNDLTAPCVYPAASTMTYQLFAKNCHVVPHEEEDMIVLGGCFNAYWVPLETKSTLQVEEDDAVWVKHDRSRNVISTSSENDDLVCFPNPGTTTVSLKSSAAMQNISILDINGKEVLILNPDSKLVDVNISALSTGVYTVKIIGETGEKRIKLVKN